MKEILYTEINVVPKLAPFVKRFWRYTNLTKNDQNYIILPDGYFDLVIKISHNTIFNISLFGICTKALEVTIPSEATILGICFKPLSAEGILKKSIAPILNTSENLPNDFWQLNNFPINDFNLWTDYITRQMLVLIEKDAIIDRRKLNIFDLLLGQNYLPSVQELSDKVYWSTRQINRYFNKELGVSLKTYINILRCFASYNSIKEGALSPNDGFYDQSHFIKEIKKHTGVSPSELHKNENDRFLQFSVGSPK